MQYARFSGTIRDRVTQMAMVVVLESIFEADLPPQQYAYRAGSEVPAGLPDSATSMPPLVNAGYTEVVDADLGRCGHFDSIPASSGAFEVGGQSVVP